MECCFFIGWQGYEFVEHPVLLEENHMEWCSNLWPASGKLDRAPPFFLHVNIMVCQSSIWMRWQWWSSTILQHPFPPGLKRPSSGTAQKMNWLFGTQWELCEHAIKVALFELPLLFFCSLLWRWEHYQSRFLCHRYFYLGCCPKAAFNQWTKVGFLREWVIRPISDVYFQMIVLWDYLFLTTTKKNLAAIQMQMLAIGQMGLTLESTFGSLYG